MFVAILIFIGLVGLAVVAYAVMQAATLNCPHCIHNGEQGLLWPIIPGFRFWCSNCSEPCTIEEARRTLSYEDEPEVVEGGYYDAQAYDYDEDPEQTTGYGYGYDDEDDDRY